MIIRFKKKIIPQLGDTRIKRKFVFFKFLDYGIAMFQNVYLKQQLKIDGYYLSDYKEEREKALKGQHYNKWIIWKAEWYTQKVYPSKKEAFIEEI